MPELPEVETMCRGVRPVIGAVIDKVVDPECTYRPIVCDPPLPELNRRLRGQRITGVSRIGKRVIIETEHWALALQPKMTGLVSIDAPPDPEHVRLVLKLRDSKVPVLTFWDRRGLGTISLLPHEEVESKLVTGKLGPDALVITAAQFAERLSQTKRPIKVALLDQKLVAGVGNLYASEMLHAAGIDPKRSAAELTAEQYKLLHKHMRRILNAAIKAEGSTLSDGTYRNALNQAGNYQNHHRVYDKAGHPCPKCRTSKIVRIVQAQRATFYCEGCQEG